MYEINGGNNNLKKQNETNAKKSDAGTANNELSNYAGAGSKRQRVSYSKGNEESSNYYHQEIGTLYNKKTLKGPSAKDYFNTDLAQEKSKKQSSVMAINTPFEADMDKAAKGSSPHFDTYVKILEGVVMHKSLLECQEVPLFM